MGRVPLLTVGFVFAQNKSICTFQPYFGNLSLVSCTGWRVCGQLPLPVFV